MLFSRNDGIGETEHNGTLIWLAEDERYLLIAVASNSRGSAEASMELFGGEVDGDDERDDEGEDERDGEGDDDDNAAPRNGGEAAPANRPPVISGLTFSTSPLYAGEPFSVTVQTSDPDGDALSYQWWVDGVIVPGPTGNSSTFPSPFPGQYELRVVVSDGRGGEAELSETVTIILRISIAVSEYVVGPTVSETGLITKGISASPGSLVYAGDDRFNNMYRGFISFDIGPLAGASIRAVEMRLKDPTIVGNPSVFHQGSQGLAVRVVHWGARPFTLEDYELLGVGIHSYFDYDITLRSIIGEGLPGERLAGELQKAIDEGKNRFQIRLSFARDISNNDNSPDAVHYLAGDIKLSVLYE